MLRKVTIVSLVLMAIVLSAAVDSDAAIVRVARKLGVVDFYGGYATPWGSYDRINDILFFDEFGESAELDADELYDNTYFFGFNYGQVRMNHVYFSLGFRWTHIGLVDGFQFNTGSSLIDAEDLNFNQYDVSFNLNYYFLSPSYSAVLPYAGLSFHGGINSFSSELFQTENKVTAAGGVNFGADFALWQSPSDRSFVTLSSVNEWIYAASSERPKYLNFGLAVKYFFRP